MFRNLSQSNANGSQIRTPDRNSIYVCIIFFSGSQVTLIILLSLPVGGRRKGRQINLIIYDGFKVGHCYVPCAFDNGLGGLVQTTHVE